MIQLTKLKNMLFEAAKVRNFQNLSTFACQNRARSLMDKIKDSGSFALGSIPSGLTKITGAVKIELAAHFFSNRTPQNISDFGFLRILSVRNTDYFSLSVIITSIAPTPNLAMLAMRFSVFL